VHPGVFDVGIPQDIRPCGDDVFEDKCGIKLSGTDFGEEGNLVLSYMKGVDGAVEFYRCNFGENALDFAYRQCRRSLCPK